MHADYVPAAWGTVSAFAFFEGRLAVLNARRRMSHASGALTDGKQVQEVTPPERPFRLSFGLKAAAESHALPPMVRLKQTRIIDRQALEHDRGKEHDIGLLYLNRPSKPEYDMLQSKLCQTQNGVCFTCEEPTELEVHAVSLDIGHVPTRVGGKEYPDNFAQMMNSRCGLK